jgi:SOS response regulatory protein OraA/RecX
MATKTSKKSPTSRTTVVRRPAVTLKPRRESWKKVLERNLIREGFSPAEAKEVILDITAA